MTQTLLPDVAWSGGHLLLGDLEAVRRVRRKRMSASASSATLKCPASMAANYLLPRVEDPFADNEIGTAMHAVFEDFYQLPASKRTHEALEELVLQHASQKWSIDRLEKQSKDALRANDTNRKRWIEIVGKLAQGIFGLEDPTRVIVLANELSIRIDLAGGVPSVCKIDRVDWIPAAPDAPGAVHVSYFEQLLTRLDAELTNLPDELDRELSYDEWNAALSGAGIHGNAWASSMRAKDARRWVRTIVTVIHQSGALSGFIAVRDYKKADNPKKLKKPQAGHSDDYGDQQRLYTLAIEDFIGVRPAQAAILFPALAHLGGWRLVDIDERALEMTAIGYRGSWDLMNKSADRAKFETRPAILCSWCDLVNSCPAANQRGFYEPGTPIERMDKFQLARHSKYSAVELGIPTIRPGAEPAEAFSSRPVGTIPELGAEPVREPVIVGDVEQIPAAGDDLFPVTLHNATAAATSPTAQPPVPGTPATEPPAGTSILGNGSVRPILPASSAPAEPADITGMWEENVPNDVQPQGAEMTENNIRVRPEALPSVEMAGDDLNLNSYAAIAVGSLISQAYKHLDEKGVPIRPETLSRFDDVLAGVLLRAQYRLTGQTTFQAGAQSRLRLLLFTFMERRPFPFAKNAQVIEKWMATAEQFLVVGAEELISLHERSNRLLRNDSHLFFVQDTPADATTPQ